jgi:hypothetical protein
MTPSSFSKEISAMNGKQGNTKCARSEKLDDEGFPLNYCVSGYFLKERISVYLQRIASPDTTYYYPSVR